MAGKSRRWMILVAIIWIQAFTGTNFDFSAYSSDLKSVLGISQVQLNYLAVASDLGKVFGWSSGLALLYLPLWLVLFVAAFMGLIGYGLQWLVIGGFLSLSYFLVFLLCLVSGCSICWFNTVCFVLCIRNFSLNRSLALSLTVSFNGVSAALYTLAANSIPLASDSRYLLLNALIPLLVSIVALGPILQQPPTERLDAETARRDSLVFLLLNLLALLTGLYLLAINSFASSVTTTTCSILSIGAVLLLIAPLLVPGVMCAREWLHHTIYSSFQLEGSGFNLVDVEDLEQLHKELLGKEWRDQNLEENCYDGDGHDQDKGRRLWEKDELVVLGEEHSAKRLLRRVDFWLYYVAYFCGGTLGIVYSNNLGQIAQSRGAATKTDALVTLYSAFSFFGRLLSAAPDFCVGWLAIALAPTPVAFFMLATVAGETALQTSTALIGLSSGFIVAAAVSITSELFGPNSFGVNHNILITNIPVGSLVYGSLAALVYDANGSKSTSNSNGILEDMIVCMGMKCYKQTFLWWGCACAVGLASSLALYLRTRYVYNRFEANRTMTQLS